MNGQRKVQKTEKNPWNHLSKICKELINLGDMFAMPPSVTATEQETVKSLPPPRSPRMSMAELGMEPRPLAPVSEFQEANHILTFNG